MATHSIYDIKGLYLADNPLAFPEGACVTAHNCVIQARGVIEPRRGQKSVSTVSSGLDTAYTFGLDETFKARSITFYQETPVIHYSDGSSTGAISKDTGSAFTDFSGSYMPPTDARVRFAQAGQSLFFTSDDGVYKLDSISGTPALSGLPAPIYLFVNSTSVTDTWMPADSVVAYRATVVYKDANDVWIEGPPSTRYIYYGGAAASSLILRVGIPSGLSTSHFVRLYRTEAVDNDIDPGEEMGLVYETAIKSADITNGFVSIWDIAPDDVQKGPIGYFAPSQEGADQANSQPPMAKDITAFDNRLWFANTTSKHRLFLTLLGCGGTKGLQTGDVVTIAGSTYTAAASRLFSTGDYVLTTSGTASRNIEETAQDLVYVINNRSGNSSVYAYYISPTAEQPGQILIEERGLGGNAFAATATANEGTLNIAIGGLVRVGSTVTATTGANHNFATGNEVDLSATVADANFPVGRKIITVTGATTFTYSESGSAVASTTAYTVTRAAGRVWSPELPASGTLISSTNDEAPNRLYYSKRNQFEAVPVLNYIDVGSRDHAIKRIVPVREKLYVFKSDGIYVVTPGSPYRVSLLDGSAILVGPETAVVLNGKVFALTTQGVVAVSDVGVRIISRVIEDEILPLLTGEMRDTTEAAGFGVAYESDRQYQLWVSDTVGVQSEASVAYVYNYVTDAWTSWRLSRYCGAVSPVTDKLYMGHGETNKLMVERKDLERTDYADDFDTVNITTVSGRTITLTSATNAQIGDVLWQDEDHWTLIIAKTGNVLTVAYDPTNPISDTVVTFNTGAAQIHNVYSTAVEFAPFFAKQPSWTKQFPEVTLHFRAFDKADFTETPASQWDTGEGSAVLSFVTELVSPSYIQVLDKYVWPMKSFPSYGLKNLRRVVTKEQQRATQLSVRFETTEANAKWQLAGYSVEYTLISPRNGRS